MKIVAIDTSSKFLCLGASDATRIYEYSVEAGVKLSGILVPTIKNVLNALQWKIEEVDYFGCGIGPGSFTGLRVGVSVIKGLAWSLKKPVIEVATLDALARNILLSRSGQFLSGQQEKEISEGHNLVVPVVDAKRGLVYSAVYQTVKGNLKRITPYLLVTPAALERRVRTLTHSKITQVIFLGDGLSLYAGELSRKIKKAKILDKDYWFIQARNVLLLAQDKACKKKIVSAFEIEPMYLYPKECQISSNLK